MAWAAIVWGFAPVRLAICAREDSWELVMPMLARLEGVKEEILVV